MVGAGDCGAFGIGEEGSQSLRDRLELGGSIDRSIKSSRHTKASNRFNHSTEAVCAWTGSAAQHSAQRVCMYFFTSRVVRRAATGRRGAGTKALLRAASRRSRRAGKPVAERTRILFVFVFEGAWWVSIGEWVVLSSQSGSRRQHKQQQQSRVVITSTESDSIGPRRSPGTEESV